MTDDALFDTIYQDVPEDQHNTLRDFRHTHPERIFHNENSDWRYILSGSGDEVVLLLVGGLRVADAAHRNIPMLEDGFRVLTPTYPALDTMNDLADGLAALLDHKNIQQVHVLAGSFGGMVAQVFVRRHPDRVKKLILSTTATLDAASVERYKQGREMLLNLDDNERANIAADMMFGIIAPPEDSHAFYRAYLTELYAHRLSKAELISTYDAIIDFAQNHSLSADDLTDWQGDILILESSDDGTFDETARSKVRDLYTDAYTYTFENAGHSPGTTQRDLYFKIVRDFLNGDVSALRK